MKSLTVIYPVVRNEPFRRPVRDGRPVLLSGVRLSGFKPVQRTIGRDNAALLEHLLAKHANTKYGQAIEVMMDGRQRTAQMLAVALKCDYSTARRALCRMLNVGLLVRVKAIKRREFGGCFQYWYRVVV